MNRIREIAAQKGIKISELIMATGLSKSYVYDVINEKSSPTISVAFRISKVLQSSIQELFPDNQKGELVSE